MKRPYIPLKVRLAVLERQAYVERKFNNEEERELEYEWYKLCTHGRSLNMKVKWLISILFNGDRAELDHDPALVLRKFNKTTGHYIPHENSPKFLVYRLKPQHLQKTTGRAPGAESTVTSKGSDVWLAKKFRKLEQPKKSKSKIPSRPFQRQRRALRRRTSLSATPAEKDF